MKNQSFAPPPHKVDKIVLPLLKEEDLEIFRGKKIVIDADNGSNLMLFHYFEKRGIPVVAFITDAWKKRYQKIGNTRYYFLKDMKKFASKSNNLIFITSKTSEKDISSHKKFCKNNNIEFAPYCVAELALSFTGRTTINSLRNDNFYKKELKIWKKELNRKHLSRIRQLYYRKPKNSVIICNPPKTADVTLVNTLEQINKEFQHTLPSDSLFHSLHAKANDNICSKIFSMLIARYYHNGLKIDYLNMWHKPHELKRAVGEKRLPKLKIITAVREPIGQNTSCFFQGLGNGFSFQGWLLPLLEGRSSTERSNILTSFIPLFVDHPEDLCSLWFAYQERNIYRDKEKFLTIPKSGAIQDFIPRFQKEVLDILAYPFDKEKGYTIIKEGNTEIFIYQLEKLNDLVPELSEWVGVPFDSLVMGNVGEDKWIGDAYKQAKKSLPITQEYFDRCFNEPYVNHCYSEADIEKFKEKWRSHIIQDDVQST